MGRYCGKPSNYSVPASVRFWKHVDKQGPLPPTRPDLGRCWVWLSGRDSKGYGRFFYNGSKLAHRVAYELETGKPVPDNLTVDHLCENKACVNPAHFAIVTALENQLRFARNQTHCRNGHCYAEVGFYIARKSRGTVTRRCKACCKATRKRNYVSQAKPWVKKGRPPKQRLVITIEPSG